MYMHIHISGYIIVQILKTEPKAERDNIKITQKMKELSSKEQADFTVENGS